MPYTWVQQYVAKKFPNEKDPDKIKKLRFMVSNVANGKSHCNGIRFGVIKDIVKIYKSTKLAKEKMLVKKSGVWKKL